MRATSLMLTIFLMGLGFACGSDPDPAPDPDQGSGDLGSPDSGADDVSVDAADDLGEETTDDAGVDVGKDIAEPAVTYHKDVRPIIEAECQACHLPGGAAGYAYVFETYADVNLWGESIAYNTEIRNMPPWPPSPDCREYNNQRLLTDEQIETIGEWVALGKPEGQEENYVAPLIEGAPDVGPSDIQMDAGADYTPDTSGSDDYHCLPMTYPVEKTMFMTGYNVLPDVGDIVHHALVYRIPAANVAEMEANDAADPDVGYACAATPQTTNFEFLGSWVPGQFPAMLPEDSGILLEKGDRFVLQMHYNTLAIPPGGPSPLDRTGLELWTRPLQPLPTYIVSYSLAVNADFAIPPGDEHYAIQSDHALPNGSTMVGIFPHMHLLGTEIRAKINHADGSETCLVDIPNWDFNWQQYFLFKKGEYVVTSEGDSMEMECIFDNSAANQPVVGGVKQEPKLVTWGEGTLDEMCLVFPMWLNACPGDVCPAMKTCLDNCAPGSLGCFLTCAGLGGEECNGCAVGAIYQCGVNQCPDEATAYTVCDKDCGAPPCCAPQLDAWYACAETALKAGTCDKDFLCCGLQYGE